MEYDDKNDMYKEFRRMTEDKRFNYTCEKTGQHWCIEISDNQTKEPFDVDYSEITDNYSQTKDNVEFIVYLLNELNDENEQLKNMVEHNYVEHKRCVNNYVDKIKEVEKENEQLKSICQDHRDHAIDFKADCVRLEKENDQLKRDLDYYKKRIKELEIENQGQSDAIDGLHDFMAHYDLEDLE